MLNPILIIGQSVLSKTDMVCFFMKVALRGENSYYLNINTRKKSFGVHSWRIQEGFLRETIAVQGSNCGI